MEQIKKRFDENGQFFVKIKNKKEALLKGGTRMIQGCIPSTIYFWEYPDGSKEDVSNEEMAYLKKIT